MKTSKLERDLKDMAFRLLMDSKPRSAELVASAAAEIHELEHDRRLLDWLLSRGAMTVVDDGCVWMLRATLAEYAARNGGDE